MKSTHTRASSLIGTLAVPLALMLVPQPVRGSCDAEIFLTPAVTALGSGTLTATVVDAAPYAPALENDCNGDGDRTDLGTCLFGGGGCGENSECAGAGNVCLGADDEDCDENGVDDVEVLLLSEGEPLGERLFLNEVASGTYMGEFAYSTRLDVPGTLFLRRNGTSAALARLLYEDRDDGGGAYCGWYEVSTPAAVPSGSVIVKSYQLTDNGDGDIFADTHETVEMAITLVNKTAFALNDLVARLDTDSPHIACISDNTIEVGAVAAGATVTTADTFTFRVGPAARITVGEDLAATFRVSLHSDEIAMTRTPQQVTVDLDLDVSGGTLPFTYTEDFEAGSTLASTKFTAMSLDGPPAEGSNAASDGFRCQITDPDNPNGNTFGEPACFLGFPGGAGNAFDWHVHDFSGSPDGGRAFTNLRSLHFGVHDISQDPSLDTTRLAQLDAVRTFNPVNLGWDGVVPELTFKQQVSFADDRTISAVPSGETLDRGVVQVQLAESTLWQTIEPYHDLYDAQGTSVVDKCMFDPVDDGNDEDAFFSPVDPFRATGPSSTCYTGRGFAFQGATDGAFDDEAIGRASDGPGLFGDLGPGTWVETRLDLRRYAGRRIRLRFLATTAKDGAAVTRFDAGVPSGDPGDDGWYVDDIRIAGALLNAAAVAVDAAPNLALPACPANCSRVTASLAASEPPIGGGGEYLSAAGSVADVCLDGTLEYEFWIDDDGDGVLAEQGETLLRAFTDLPELFTSISEATTYGVRVRCSSDASCLDSASVYVATPGEAQILDALDIGSGNVLVTYAQACEATDHAVYWGPCGDPSAWSGQMCSVGTLGAVVINPGNTGCLGYVVVGHDGSLEGPYGKDSNGDQRSPSGACSLVQDLPLACP